MDLAPRQLTAKQAEQYTGTSPKKLGELANDGLIIRKYVGNRPRFERASLDEWMDNLPGEPE